MRVEVFLAACSAGAKGFGVLEVVGGAVVAVHGVIVGDRWRWRQPAPPADAA